MADSRKTVQIKSDPIGDVRIADEVVAIIAGLAKNRSRWRQFHGGKHHKRNCQQARHEEPF